VICQGLGKAGRSRHFSAGNNGTQWSAGNTAWQGGTVRRASRSLTFRSRAENRGGSGMIFVPPPPAPLMRSWKRLTAGHSPHCCQHRRHSGVDMARVNPLPGVQREWRPVAELPRASYAGECKIGIMRATFHKPRPASA